MSYNVVYTLTNNIIAHTRTRARARVSNVYAVSSTVRTLAFDDGKRFGLRSRYFQEYADSVPHDPQVQAADLSKNLRK